jgi:CRISPR-associated protein Cmr6
MTAPNTAPLLAKLLEQQHQTRSPHLFKSGIFTLVWRGKVGSFPAPDLETLISAGEPSGRWDWCPSDYGNLDARRPELPINGYIPGSAIRGVVRSWAMQQPDLKERAIALLGHQDEDKITAGKVEFLDAWTATPTKLALDITNPQQKFQVYHKPQGEPQSCTPLPLYTMGNGQGSPEFTISIRGIPGRATEAEVNMVWQWVQQALHTQGVGSRTASGYGIIQTPSQQAFRMPIGYSLQSFGFVLYSQGCAGVNPKDFTELRPSHWRGWLRSWVLRFLLGVMSEQNAELSLAELMGTLEPEMRKGCVRLRVQKGKTWGIPSEDENAPTFYIWKGQLQISAPTNILEKILLPIIRFAISVGGVGRGWRRPLHIFHMNNGRAAARGTLLRLAQRVPNPQTKKVDFLPLILSVENDWLMLYQEWLGNVREFWQGRILADESWNPNVEAFSPTTCAIHAVPGPVEEPIDQRNQCWAITDAHGTRGDGMELIYQSKYKRKADVGGDAANGKASCSWVSIKRLESLFPNPDGKQEKVCQEIVCLFMGGQPDYPKPTERQEYLRSQFLKDLAAIEGAVHLFGVQAPPSFPS